ncbi:hypothetical protein KMW28_27015 [Flammeovirga yaeyamensis]|uniref:Transposase n=1 Tax=Flammeovirga yaeyamensis TaxID=367791 RepID=A0AAX1NC80_9BACT|nr:hypothetical protein [Flammeovirga yaeyamensis]MBB3700072.1 hypothetical protein [Flammeovirga yaeyamensis]NMF37494.1 hypothetical protein [Flammeovirga yaeyamensis]QWG04551.1 hypothetical protein KMW28_27015 [Flammeovirga yaeyamensis]
MDSKQLKEHVLKGNVFKELEELHNLIQDAFFDIAPFLGFIKEEIDIRNFEILVTDTVDDDQRFKTLSCDSYTKVYLKNGGVMFIHTERSSEDDIEFLQNFKIVVDGQESKPEPKLKAVKIPLVMWHQGRNDH